MPAVLKNKFVLLGGVILILFILWITLLGVVNTFSTSTSLSEDSVSSSSGFAPGVAPGGAMNRGAAENVAMDMDISYPAPTPYPTPDGYTSGLERYETTDYSVQARTTQFDELCQLLAELKTENEYDFRSLSESLNSCTASFFTSDALAPAVAERFQEYDGVTISRNVSSVTRHRQQLESQAGILEQQLESVNGSLALAETEFDEIASFARENNDASTFSEAIREKLSLIDTLTQRRIQLTSRLENIYQQAADLEERIGVTQFSVSIHRSYPLDPDEKRRSWERAWEALSETYTDTLIGLTAFFAIFLLWAVRITIYLAVVLILVRLLWKFVRIIWRY